MSVLSAQTIKAIKFFDEDRCRHMIEPFEERTQHRETNTSYGLSFCGYDVRVDQDIHLKCGDFMLASTMEHFRMPFDIMAYVKDKSSWARRGLAVQNTVIEPGWRGFLTLELTNHSPTLDIVLPRGSPVAQIIFHKLDQPAVGYNGKYQDQERGPQEAR
jgi:dCTP deaminase